jgi:RNA polymerase sigma-70 factor (ECF subfamily)
MDRHLFWKLAEVEHIRAEAFCRRLEGNKDDGDDLYQEALVKAWDKFSKLRRRESFRPWFYRIIINLFKSKIRRKRWLGVDAAVKNVTEQAYDPSRRLMARLRIKRAFRVLSVDDQAIVSLFEIEGWSVAEIARIYEKPEGTIKSRLSRARGKMRKELGRLFPEVKDEMREIGTGYAMPRSKTSLE